MTGALVQLKAWIPCPDWGEGYWGQPRSNFPYFFSPGSRDFFGFSCTRRLPSRGGGTRLEELFFAFHADRAWEELDALL